MESQEVGEGAGQGPRRELVEFGPCEVERVRRNQILKIF